MVVTEPAEAAAGVEADRATYVLRFDGTTPGVPAGLVVRMRKPTAGGHVDLAFAGAVGGGLPDVAAAAAGDPTTADALYRMFRAFAASLRSWNLLDEGDPVPATLDGLLSQELELAAEVTFAWLEHVGQAERDRAAVEASLQLPVEALNG